MDGLLRQKRDGVFVDIGAHDGRSCSNSLFFEENRGWTGICIEPGPEEFAKLISSRKSINVNACVSDYDGEADFTYISGHANMLSGLAESYDPKHQARISREMTSFGGQKKTLRVPVFRLQTILDRHGILEIDYCSIDTEGTEFKIIQSIDFEKTKVTVFTVENNYQTTEIKEYLETKGYRLHRKLQWDDVFIKA